MLQLDNQRTIKEKLPDREKMLESDECFQYFKSPIESEAKFNNVSLAW